MVNTIDQWPDDSNDMKDELPPDVARGLSLDEQRRELLERYDFVVRMHSVGNLPGRAPKFEEWKLGARLY